MVPMVNPASQPTNGPGKAVQLLPHRLPNGERVGPAILHHEARPNIAAQVRVRLGSVELSPACGRAGRGRRHHAVTAIGRGPPCSRQRLITLAYGPGHLHRAQEGAAVRSSGACARPQYSDCPCSTPSPTQAHNWSTHHAAFWEKTCADLRTRIPALGTCSQSSMPEGCGPRG